MIDFQGGRTEKACGRGKKELERKYQAFLKEEAERRRIQLEETLRLTEADFDRDIYAGYVESILPYIEPEGRRFYRAFQG